MGWVAVREEEDGVTDLGRPVYLPGCPALPGPGRGLHHCQCALHDPDYCCLPAGCHGTDLVPVLATRSPPEQAIVDAGSFPPNFQWAEAYLASLAQLQDGHAYVESVEG